MGQFNLSVNRKARTMQEGMGITRERLDELARLASVQGSLMLMEEKPVMYAIEDAVKNAENINEVALLTMFVVEASQMTKRSAKYKEYKDMAPANLEDLEIYKAFKSEGEN